MKKEPLSVVIITFNEEKNIERCIRSVQSIADEILVLDSFSKDRTQAIAEELGARFETHAFDGHIQQKNRAWQMATHDWVLSIDADEAPDEVLQKSILEALQRQAEREDKVDGYTMNRLTNYCGSWVRHSGWYPDTKMRLFQKGKGAWGGVNPHDKFELHAGGKSIHLKGDLLHYSYYSVEDHYQQIEYFSDIASKELHEMKKSISSLMIYLKVVAQFFKTYVLKLGVLDGGTGFTIARLSAYATFRKYRKLQLRNQGKYE